MKTTIVPAQVTTVEDRIAGGLSLTQLLLLSIPVFSSSLLYAVLPPGFRLAPYKLVLFCAIVCSSGLLAIRIRGKLVLVWLRVGLRYRLRPRVYVFTKQTGFARGTPPAVPAVIERAEATPVAPAPKRNPVPVAALIQLQGALEAQTGRISYHPTKKGGIYVRVTERDR